MSLVSPVYEQHYKAYLNQLAGLDFLSLARDIGGGLTTDPDGPCMEIVYFNHPYRISPSGIMDGSGRKPEYDTCIVLCRYLAIAGTLSGQISRSQMILESLNPSRPDMDLHYDLALRVDALPRIPLLVLANDAEEGFPATCSVLFESRVETFLDAECIAMVGYRLAQILGKLFS